MSEPALLEYLRGYGFDYPSLESAFRADSAKTLEKLCDASYHHHGWFTPEIVDAILERFSANPGNGFWILHNLATQDESRARKLMARHFDEAKNALRAASKVGRR